MKEEPYWIDTPFNTHFINSINLFHKSSISFEKGDFNDENMYSTQTILNIVLTIEAIANCLIDDLDLGKRMKDEIDKFRILSKFDFYLNNRCDLELDYGTNQVQRVSELISMRNDLVHTKIKTGTGVLKPSSESNSMREFTYNLKDKYNNTKIIKLFNFWGLDEAKIAVISFLDFVNYIFSESLSFTIYDTSMILLPKMYDKGEGIYMIDDRLSDSFNIISEVLNEEVTPFVEVKGNSNSKSDLFLTIK